MRVGAAFLLVCLIAAGTASAAGLGSRLAGEWRGDKLTLVLDPERGQARVNPDKPFQWERFIVKSVSGQEVVFTVGVRLFVATLDGDTLAIEAPGFKGVQILQREREPPTGSAPSSSAAPAPAAAEPAAQD